MSRAMAKTLAAVVLAFAFIRGVGLAQAPKPVATETASTGAPADTVKKILKDRSLHGIDAVEVTIPAKWHFQGGMYLSAVGGGFEQPDCGRSPTAVYRATSPDGLSFVEQLPAPAWGWASGTHASWHSGKGCFPLEGPTSTQDFLKYLAATMSLEYVADDPPPAEDSAQLQKMVRETNARLAQQSVGTKFQPAKWTVDLARAAVRYMNGTFLMAGRLDAQVLCSEIAIPEGKSAEEKTDPPPTVIDHCVARVVYLTAPESRFADLTAQWDRHGMGARPLDTYLNARAEWSTREIKNDLQSSFIRNEERLSWRSEVEHSIDVRKKMFDQYNIPVQLGMNGALAASAKFADSRHSIPPDWVDFWLNPKSDTESGGTIATQATWFDAAEKNEFESKDPEANPNGILPGTWVKRPHGLQPHTPQ